MDLEHDHLVVCSGIDQGFPMWDLICVHEATDFFHRDIHDEWFDQCLIQSWWDLANIDIIHSTDLRYDNDPPGLAVVTTYIDGDEPLLRSLANAKEWKEGMDY